jgi:hypothetical protein
MAIAKVRDGGQTSATGTTGPMSVPAAGHALGNTIFVCVSLNGSTCTGITDSKGNTYTKQATSNDELTLWSSVLTTALVSGDTITAAAAGSGNFAAASGEYSGVQGTVDQSTQKLQTPGAGTTITTTTTAATTVADELVFGCFLVGGTVGSFVPSGYTSLNNPQNVIANLWCFKIVSSTGTQACSALIDANVSYRAIGATFPITAAGGGGTNAKNLLTMGVG